MPLLTGRSSFSREKQKVYIVTSIDVIKKMLTLITQKQKPWIRSPTLQTVLMVEKFIKEHNSEYTKTEIFRKLPKKVMWGTFQVIMKYLEDTYKIVLEKNGVITYIWNPELFEKIKDMPDIEL